MKVVSVHKGKDNANQNKKKRKSFFRSSWPLSSLISIYVTILITAGPTQEAIDPVRYLTNRSSGKMGYALAEQALGMKHRVILISGPTQLDIPAGADFIPVESAREMFTAVERFISQSDIAIFAAAVADYRPTSVPEQKIKKSSETMTLELVKNPDILGSCRDVFHYQGVLVGFAAETEKVEEHARGKLLRKGCDLLIANDVSRQDIGFDQDENEIMLITAEETIPLPKDSKKHLASHVIKEALLISQEKAEQ